MLSAAVQQADGYRRAALTSADPGAGIWALLAWREQIKTLSVGKSTCGVLYRERTKEGRRRGDAWVLGRAHWT